MTYYQQHREEILAKARAARAADPEKFRAYQQRRRAANPEANRRACAAWARQNPGKVLARVKRWQRLNPERLKEQRQRANATRRARRRAPMPPGVPGDARQCHQACPETRGEANHPSAARSRPGRSVRERAM
jgi:hypothetical protein